MARKKQSTLYSNQNNVDINNILRNPDLVAAVNIKSQVGGAKSKSVKKTRGKNKNYSDDEYSISSGGGDSDEDIDDEEEEEEETDAISDVNSDLDENPESDDDEKGAEDEGSDKAEESADEDESDKESEKGSDDGKQEIGEEDIKKKCYSKYALVDADDIDLEELFADDEFKLTKTARLSKPVLFKYERVRLLSTRAKQLANGAKPMVKDTEGLSSKEIALLELKNKLIPMIIERPIPNSGVERWKLSELEIID